MVYVSRRLFTEGGYTLDLDLGVVTHPRLSRYYPVKVFNYLNFTDDMALLESTVPQAMAQLTRTAATHHFQVCGESINHVTDFRNLCSQWHYALRLQNVQGTSLECFFEAGKPVWMFLIVNLYES